MKWLMLMLSFAFRKSPKTPSLKETALEIFEEVSHKSRRIVSLTLTGIAAVIFFCGGFFISLFNATTQYDSTGNVFLTATLSGGLGLIALAAITFGLVFLRAWPGVIEEKHRAKAEQAQAPGGSLEQALAMLVRDFVKEREMRRQSEASAEPPEEPTRRGRASEKESSAPLH